MRTPSFLPGEALPSPALLVGLATGDTGPAASIPTELYPVDPADPADEDTGDLAPGIDEDALDADDLDTDQVATRD